MKDVRNAVELIAGSVERVILGKSGEVQLTLLALLCEGHLLIEDVPGVGKTMLARSLARSLGCSFRRIQFTPDLLPSDVTGVSVFNQKTLEFEFRPGPILSQIVLADEINRATPKTQSALLEAMEERQVTVDGITPSAAAAPAWCWLRRTQSSTKAPSRCPKRNWIASSCAFALAIPANWTRWPCWTHNSSSTRSLQSPR